MRLLHRRATGCLAWALVRFGSTIVLAATSAALQEELEQREVHATKGRPSPRQLQAESLTTCAQILAILAFVAALAWLVSAI